jgi:hypothetical protein
MYTLLFADYGIPVVDQQVEVRRDPKGLPRFCFRSDGNPVIELDLLSAGHLFQKLRLAGDMQTAAEFKKNGDVAKLERHDFRAPETDTSSPGISVGLSPEGPNRSGHDILLIALGEGMLSVPLPPTLGQNR